MYGQPKKKFLWTCFSSNFITMYLLISCRLVLGKCWSGLLHITSFFFFFYWAPVAIAPGSTAACRLIVRARIWKFPIVPPGAPRLQRLERPLAGKGGTMREKCLVNFAVKYRVPRYLKGSLKCRKSATWDRRLCFPSEGRHSEDFFAGSNPRTWVPEASMLTPRPPKPLSFSLVISLLFTKGSY
jgi:hypothetical protein